MEKILTISGKEVPFKSSGAFFLRYRSQFGKDPLREIMLLNKGLEEYNKTGSVEHIDTVVLFNLIWALAKTANPDIKPPMEWLDEFDEFPVFDLLPELEDMLVQSLGTSKSVKNV